jgi:glycine cleavage system transcriptional repressor
MARYLLTAQAADRPGVVATVSGVVAEHGWSVEDASMTRLAGRFAMLLVLNVPDGLGVATSVKDYIAARLDPVDVRFTVEPVEHASLEDDENPISDGTPWTVTVYGSDRPGIVSAITKAMARHSVNIDNLATRTSAGPSGQVYSMLIDATVPTAVDGDAFAAELSDVAADLGVTCHATPVDVDVL